MLERVDKLIDDGVINILLYENEMRHLLQELWSRADDKSLDFMISQNEVDGSTTVRYRNIIITTCHNRLSTYEHLFNQPRTSPFNKISFAHAEDAYLPLYMGQWKLQQEYAKPVITDDIEISNSEIEELLNI